MSCYGCGTPGVIRSNCTKCTPPKIKGDTEIGLFLANNATGTQQTSRPVVSIEICGTTGGAYVDTGAKQSVAGQRLYKLLLQHHYHFEPETVRLVLADGKPQTRQILHTSVDVVLESRTIPTKFMVLPGEDNRTLLGIDFLRQAGLV